MNPLDLIRLSPLMARGQGRSEIVLALIDGPVAVNHPEFSGVMIREIGNLKGVCSRLETAACIHGTFVAGILCARRGSAAPAVCPGCTLLVRTIFSEAHSGNDEMPNATTEDLAQAIVDCVDAGARLINISSALAKAGPGKERELEQALNYTASRHVILVAAGGNQGTLGGSAIVRHRWVIPVVACNVKGEPLRESILGASIGRNGLGAPGENITSIGANGNPLALSGTSAAAPFVTGTIALLWSEFPNANAAEIKLSITRHVRQRNSVVPPVLDATAAHQILSVYRRRQ
jgi:subtilisin family serine protease